MDESRDEMDLITPDGMRRREFLHKLLAAAVGLPAATALLSGCDGHGILEPPENGAAPGPGPQGDLGEEVQDMRDVITSIIQAMQNMGGAGDAELAGWLAQINAQLEAVWPLMVGAGQQDLRDNVSPEMQQFLDQLDDWQVPLNYSGGAPQFSEAALQAAWDRAEGLLLPQAAGDGPYATEQTWAFFLMLFLIFPGIGGGEAFNFATGAAGMDTGNQASGLFSLLHPSGGIACTPCFISALLTGLLSIVMLLFMGMASHTSMAPSMLFGRDYVIVLAMLAALFILFLASG